MVQSMYYRERPILVPLHTETPSIASARFPPETVTVSPERQCRIHWT